MKVGLNFFLLLLILTALTLLVSFFFTKNYKNTLQQMQSYRKTRESVIITVGCGATFVPKILSVIRSALLFSKSTEKLRFEVFCDFKQRSIIERSLERFKSLREFTINMHNPSFPKENRYIWQNMFAKCSAQRIFVANILTEVDAAIYVDTDVLFLASPGEMFQIFEKFSERQLAAMVFNSYENTSWYPKKAKNPFYGKFGLNAGVIFMNLTRMREINFERNVMTVMKEYHNFGFKWGDQCLLNTYFKYYPQQVYELPSEYNYRTDFCNLRLNITSLKLLHGSRHVFEKPKSPFYALFKFLLNVSIRTCYLIDRNLISVNF